MLESKVIRWYIVATILIFCWNLVSSAPIISSIEVDNISHSSVTIRVYLAQAVGSSDRVDFGTNTALGSSTYTMLSQVSTMKSVGIGGLAPSTKYYFNPVIADDSGTSVPFLCSDSNSGSGYSCDGPGTPPSFVTVARPSDSPIPPHSTTTDTFDIPMPEIDGSSFIMPVDESNRCVSITETFNAAGQADQNLNHEIVIPAGGICDGPVILPVRSGPGYIVVRTSSMDLLPPEGVRTDPSYLPFMASLVLHPKYGKNSGNNGVIRAFDTHYWRFVGIEFTTLDPSEVTPVYYSITQISLDDQLVLITLNDTITDNELMTSHSLVSVAGVEGLIGLNMHHRVYSRDQAPTNTLMLDLLSSSVTGSWVVGTGLVYAAHRPIDIESVSNEMTPVITTKTPHMLIVSPKISITSINDGVITISSSHNYEIGFGVVQITSSSVSQFNGLWGISSLPSDTSMTMLGNFPAGQCSSNCGFIEVKTGTQVSGVPGILSGVLYEVLSPTSFRVLTTAGPLSGYNGGGWVVQDIDIMMDFITLFSTSSKFVFDRCIFNGRGFPYRYLYAVQMSANDSVVMNSIVQDFSNWKGIKPITNTYEYAKTANYVAVAFSISTGVNKMIYNNLVKDIPGITIFAEEFGAVMPFNVIVERNTIQTDLKFMAGSDTSNGRYYFLRHQMEVKVGRQFKIKGNIFSGNWADAIPLGPSILLSPRAGDGSNLRHGIADFDISDNTIINTSEGIMIFGHETLSSKSVENTQRIRISNNIIDVDYYYYRSLPSKDGPTKVGNFGGQPIYLDYAFEDISITHNTGFSRGRAPVFAFIGNCRVSGILIENNIGEFNNDEQYGGFISSAGFYGQRDVKPTIDSTNSRTAFEDCAVNSKLLSNVVIPGVTNSTVRSNFEVSDYSISKADCDARMNVFDSVYCVGTDNANELPADRMDLVGFIDWRNKNYELKPTSEFAAGNAKQASDGKSMGVDFDRLYSVQGRVLDVKVEVNGKSVSIQYKAPDSDICHVDISNDNAFGKFIRTADAGGDRDRKVDLDLSSGSASEYYYRIQCAAEQPSGVISLNGNNSNNPSRISSGSVVAISYYLLSIIFMS